MDLTVAATPGFLVSIAAERKWLERRAKRVGPSPADYTPNDARASIAMGTLSLVAPFVIPKLVAPFAPRGKFGKAVITTALIAGAITSLADAVERAMTKNALSATPTVDTSPNRAKRRDGVLKKAQAVRALIAPAAVISAGLAATGAWRSVTSRRTLFAHRVLPDLGSGPVPFALAMLGWDFVYYWNHRFMHEARYMWAIHVVHHSSEHYNLSTALRQPVADALGTFIPDGVLCALGIRPSLVEQSRAINLLYQYWIHTDAIRTLGPLEWVFNTPSHHRAHHGSNHQYLDRNHGGILIAWDRCFGTFERERERVVYGLTKNISTYNPARIATHEYRDILHDVATANNWSDRASFVVRGPGWAYDRHATNERVQAIGTHAS